MSCSTNVITIKKGDSFSRACRLLDDTDTPIDLTDYTIESQVRDSRDNLIATLTATKYNQTTNPGVFMLSAEDGTDSWPSANLGMDIVYTVDGIIQHTEDITVSVIRSKTHV